MAQTNYLRNKVLDHINGVTTYTKPTTVYVGLYSSNPTVTGTAGTEVTGGSYARQAVTFGAATAGSAASSTQAQFTNMPSTTVAYVTIHDAATGGNMLQYKALATPVTFTLGDQYTLSAGQITTTLA